MWPMAHAVQTSRDMRLAVLAVLAWSGTATAEPDPSVDPPMRFVPSVALRAGVHHTHIRKGEGEPDGNGPKLELEVYVRPLPYVMVSAVAGYSSYGSDGLYDGISGSSYGTSFEDTWLGARLYLRPHWRGFVGLGLFRLSETEEVTGSPSYSESHHETVVEAIVGVNLGWAGGFLFQLAATRIKYSQYFELEHVTSYALLFGVAR